MFKKKIKFKWIFLKHPYANFFKKNWTFSNISKWGFKKMTSERNSQIKRVFTTDRKAGEHFKNYTEQSEFYTETWWNFLRRKDFWTKKWAFVWKSYLSLFLSTLLCKIFMGYMDSNKCKIKIDRFFVTFQIRLKNETFPHSYLIFI